AKLVVSEQGQVSYVDFVGTTSASCGWICKRFWRHFRCGSTFSRSSCAGRRDEDGGLFRRVAGQLRNRRLVLRRGLERLVNSSPMIMRLLASTAAPTNSAKRSAPSARQRFMPRPRINTEMRPSMPARKRWPCLNAADLSWSRRRGVLLLPRCGIETVPTPPCTHTALAEEAAIGAVKLRSATESTAMTPQRGRHMNLIYRIA